MGGEAPSLSNELVAQEKNCQNSTTTHEVALLGEKLTSFSAKRCGCPQGWVFMGNAELQEGLSGIPQSSSACRRMWERD